MRALLLVTIALVFPEVAETSNNVPRQFSLDLNVSMSGKFDEFVNERYIFAIDVTPARGPPWRVMHPFHDFRSLVSELGTAAAVMKNAPFATTFQGLEEYGWFICDRRKTTEVWLQHVLKHPRSKDIWKGHLQRFLHPNAKLGSEGWFGYLTGGIKVSLGMGAKEDKIPHMRVDEADLRWLDVGISMSGKSDRVDGETHIFAIEVTSVSKETWTVMHRFNDFFKLCGELGVLSQTMCEAPFPQRHLSSGQNYDEFLAERRTALAKWLQAVIKHRHCRGPWAKPLKEFLLKAAKGMSSGSEAIATDASRLTSAAHSETLTECHEATAKNGQALSVL